LYPFLLSTAPFGEPGAVPHPLPLGVTSIDAARDLSVEVISSDAAGATVDVRSDPSYVTQCTDGVSNETSWGQPFYDDDDYGCRTGAGLSELEPPPRTSLLEGNVDLPARFHAFVAGLPAPQD
jgi:hypothetical protein